MFAVLLPVVLPALPCRDARRPTWQPSLAPRNALISRLFINCTPAVCNVQLINSLMSPQPEPSFAQLTVQGLQRSVGSGSDSRVIIQSLSFTVTSGETVFITGPSGVGKSLLLRTLAYLGGPCERSGKPAAHL